MSHLEHVAHHSLGVFVVHRHGGLFQGSQEHGSPAMRHKGGEAVVRSCLFDQANTGKSVDNVES